MRQKILLVIRAAVSLLLMAALIYMVRDSIPKMCYTVKHLPLSILLFGLFLFFLSIFIVSFRLKLLLATQDIFLNTTDIAKLTFISYFFSSFLPTSIGGDVVKAFYISKISNKTMQSYASVFIDRFLGMAAIFLIAACTFFYSKEMSKSHPRWLLPLLLIASVLFLIFLFNKRLTKMFAFFIVPFVTEKAKAKFRNIYDSIHDFAKYKFQMIECILISIIGQVSAFFAVYIYVLGLNSYIPLKFVLLAMSVASIVSMLPSIYGTGPREMSIVIILDSFIGKDKAVAIAFLWLGILLLTALIGGIIYIFIGRYKIKLSEVTG